MGRTVMSESLCGRACFPGWVRLTAVAAGLAAVCANGGCQGVMSVRPGSLGWESSAVTVRVIHGRSASVPSAFSWSSSSSAARQMPTLRSSPTGRHNRARWPVAANSRARTASAARRQSTSS